jgi:ATP phosphoribosyltransferase
VIERKRLRIAVQKSGRLSEKSLALLEKCGLDFDVGVGRARMLYQCADFPIDLMLVRDDDIPEYVADGVCDLGIVGTNVLEERFCGDSGLTPETVEILRKLGFGRCRLSIAVPDGFQFKGPRSLKGKRIATSYPGRLRRFLADNKVKAEIIELSGSVEIAPSLEVADAVCDLVSTGSTLLQNGLKEVLTVVESQAVLIRTRKTGPASDRIVDLLLRRVDGVLRAAESKYIMMNASRAALPRIQEIIPGMEEPSIMPLGASGERIAIHAVAREPVFWDTIERLKQVGASSILVLSIEKIIA